MSIELFKLSWEILKLDQTRLGIYQKGNDRINCLTGTIKAIVLTTLIMINMFAFEKENNHHIKEDNCEIRTIKE